MEVFYRYRNEVVPFLYGRAQRETKAIHLRTPIEYANHLPSRCEDRSLVMKCRLYGVPTGRKKKNLSSLYRSL